MNKVIISLLAILMTSSVVQAEMDFAQYKEHSLKKMSQYLAQSKRSVVWQLIDATSDDKKIAKVLQGKNQQIIQKDLEKYFEAIHFSSKSNRIGLFCGRLNDIYSNANLYSVPKVVSKEKGDAEKSKEKQVSYSHPIGLSWRVLPHNGAGVGNKVRVSCHTRSNRICSDAEMAKGYLPAKILISFVIEDLKVLNKDGSLNSEATMKNLFCELAPKLKVVKSKLEESYKARKVLNDKLKAKLLARVKTGELPVSEVMVGAKSQDLVEKLNTLWDANENEPASLVYAVDTVIFNYLLTKHFRVEKDKKSYFYWPQKSDFGKLLAHYKLNAGGSSKSFVENEKYFESTYNGMVDRFNKFNKQIGDLRPAERKKYQVPHHFLPSLGGANSPLRMLLFEKCFNINSWKFDSLKECRIKTIGDYEKILEKRKEFVKTLEFLWNDIVKMWDMKHDYGSVSDKMYNERRFVMVKPVNIRKTNLYKEISRLFFDHHIGIVDNKLMLQLDKNKADTQLESSLKRRLLNYDGVYVNLADIYQTRDEDLKIKSYTVRTKQVYTMTGEVNNLSVRYLSVDGIEIYLKQDRDAIWGMLLAQANLPQSRTQYQGSCVTNAFLNVYSKFKKQNPNVCKATQKQLTKRILEYSLREFKDIRDGMSNGQNQNLYERVLAEFSDDRCKWDCCDALTRPDITAWIEKKVSAKKAIWFSIYINYTGFPFLDIISGGRHIVSIVGISDIPGVSSKKYVFINDSNGKYYALPIEMVLDNIERLVSNDYGRASGDPSYFHQLTPNIKPNRMLKTIELAKDSVKPVAVYVKKIEAKPANSAKKQKVDAKPANSAKKLEKDKK